MSSATNHMRPSGSRPAMNPCSRMVGLSRLLLLVPHHLRSERTAARRAWDG
jgi:hypothetical protein